MRKEATTSICILDMFVPQPMTLDQRSASIQRLDNIQSIIQNHITKVISSLAPELDLQLTYTPASEINNSNNPLGEIARLTFSVELDPIARAAKLESL